MVQFVNICMLIYYIIAVIQQIMKDYIHIAWKISMSCFGKVVRKSSCIRLIFTAYNWKFFVLHQTQGHSFGFAARAKVSFKV